MYRRFCYFQDTYSVMTYFVISLKLTQNYKVCPIKKQKNNLFAAYPLRWLLNEFRNSWLWSVYHTELYGMCQCNNETGYWDDFALLMQVDIFSKAIDALG